MARLVKNKNREFVYLDGKPYKREHRLMCIHCSKIHKIEDILRTRAKGAIGRCPNCKSTLRKLLPPLPIEYFLGA